MRVFVSWSGNLSKELAETIRKWLPSALQYVKPYFTPADIEKGSKWATEIFKELSASTVCIIVLTRENLDSNWIMFEAGAISCTIERARVCPVIFEIEQTDLQGPLAQFQATKFTKEDMRRLFNTINTAAAEQKLSEAVADTVFEKWWPDLEAELKKTLINHKTTKTPIDIRSERELIEELLLLTRKFATDLEGKKEPTSPPVAVKYEATFYKKLFSTIEEIFQYGGFDNSALTAMKQTFTNLQSDAQGRVFAPPIKVGMVKDIKSFLATLEKYLDDKTATSA